MRRLLLSSRVCLVFLQYFTSPAGNSSNSLSPTLLLCCASVCLSPLLRFVCQSQLCSISRNFPPAVRPRKVKRARSSYFLAIFAGMARIAHRPMNNAAEGGRLRGQGSFPLSLRFLATQKFPRAAGWGRSDGTGNDTVRGGRAILIPPCRRSRKSSGMGRPPHVQFVIVDLCLGADGGVREKLCPPER